MTEITCGERMFLNKIISLEQKSLSTVIQSKHFRKTRKTDVGVLSSFFQGLAIR